MKQAFSSFACLLFVLLTFHTVHGQVMITYAGNGTAAYTGDGGLATAAELNTPSGVVTDHIGNLYITDQLSNCVRKVDTSGIITSLAGNGGTSAYSGDGGPATAAELYWPQGIGLDTSGNLYIADQFNNAIRKITVATGLISTIAGGGPIGYAGDGGPATDASLWHPADVAADRYGNVYFVDQDNNAVRKVSHDTITTVAGDGTAAYSGDGGPASAAQLNFPQGIAVDTAGNVFVADYYNSRIRKIDVSTGIITTVAGNDTAAFSGDGGPATDASLYYASAVALDDSGNIFISDYGNSRIRKVTAATGIITTIAGNGMADYCCDCQPATDASMYFPQGVAAAPNGDVYIADYANKRVRAVTYHSPCPSVGLHTATAGGIKLFPNPSQGELWITVGEDVMEAPQATIWNVLGEKVYQETLTKQQNRIDLAKAAEGVYLCRVRSGARVWEERVMIMR